MVLIKHMGNFIFTFIYFRDLLLNLKPKILLLDHGVQSGLLFYFEGLNEVFQISSLLFSVLEHF
jgi:hypothetical protein